MHMNDLLSAAVNSHGGLSRWSQLKTVTATLSITGAIWEVKGKPDALKDVSIEAQPQKESLTTHFNGQGKRTVSDPNRITVQTESGRIVSRRNDPRSAFRGHTLHTSWDDMHLVYCHTPKALLVSLQNTSPSGDDNLLSASDEVGVRCVGRVATFLNSCLTSILREMVGEFRCTWDSASLR
jgi:hypothetical protein